MTDIVNKVNSLKEIKGVDWMVYEDNEEYCEILYEDVEGRKIAVPFHSPGNVMGYYEIDCVIHNMILQMLFKENHITCPYIYPIGIDSILGLVNDARKLFRMKEQGNESEFSFKYCLPYVYSCTHHPVS